MQKELSHARYVLVNRLAMPVGAFVLLIAIGRHSDALLGQYALVMTFYFVMQMLPLLGLTLFVMREVARDPSAAGRYLATIGALSMAGCALVDVSVWLALPLLGYPAEVKQAIAMVGLLIFPGILLFLAEIIFMSVQRARPVAIVAVWENVARVTLSVVAMELGGGLLALFGVFFATRLAALAAYLVLLRRLEIVPRWEPVDVPLLRRTIGLLPAFFAGTVLLAVFSRLDFLVLSLYEPVESLGYYAIAYRPFEITIMMLTALLMAIFPKVSRVFAHTPRRYAMWSRDVVLVFCGVLAAASLVGVLVAQEYVHVLFTRQYPRPVTLTQLYMAAVLLAGLDFVGGALLHAADRQLGDTRAMLFGGLAQLGLLLVLIPSLGLIGALAAKVAATFVQCTIKFVLLRHAFGPILRRGDAWRLALVGGLLGAAAWSLLGMPWPVRWIAAALLAGVVLPSLCLALGLVQPLRMLRARWRRGHAAEPSSLRDLVDLVVADAREHARHRRTRPSRMDRALGAVMLYRLARFFHLRGRSGLAGAVVRAGSVLTRRAIDPASPQRPAWEVA